MTGTNIGLGLDAGGTYTDAVLIDLSDYRVIEKAKSLTTKDDLSKGINNSISSLDERILKKVVTVSLSSTLATNSVIEGKGCRVGLIAAGGKFDRSIPVDEYIHIDGGHDLFGKQDAILDEKAAEAFLVSIKGRVDAVAVSSYMSVTNPDHENRLKKLAKKILDVPVVCGHELSSDLGFSERAVTSIMNARLIPVIKELIESVKNILELHQIHAPLMVVRGNGSVMSESIALEKPVETILSGPAASLIGAKTMTGRNDAIVVDVGGTTTDIGILRGGKPKLNEEGAVIGGKRTKVLAAEIMTSGIGGDSRIIVDFKKFKLDSERVIPLCVAAETWPELEERLKDASEKKNRPFPETMFASSTIQDIEYFVKAKNVGGPTLTGNEKKMLDLIAERPMTLREIGAALNVHPLALVVSNLERFGMIQRIGLTPTDILHAERSYVEYNAKASDYGVKHMAFKMGMSIEDFIVFVKEKVIEKMSMELIKKLLMEETGITDISGAGKEFADKFISGKCGADYGCSITLNKPIIGIGAPVNAYLPQLAAKFHTELLIPENSDVGNAIGAITSVIAETVDMMIRPQRGFTREENPKCVVSASFGMWTFGSLDAGLVFAESSGKKEAERRARENGADEVEITVEKDVEKYSFGNDEKSDELVKIQMRITAIGRIKSFSR